MSLIILGCILSKLHRSFWLRKVDIETEWFYLPPRESYWLKHCFFSFCFRQDSIFYAMNYRLGVTDLCQIIYFFLCAIKKRRRTAKCKYNTARALILSMQYLAKPLMRVYYASFLRKTFRKKKGKSNESFISQK